MAVIDWNDDKHRNQALASMEKFHRAEGRPPTHDDVATPAGRRAGMPARFAFDRIFSDGANGWGAARAAYDAHVKALPKKERPATKL